MVYLIQPVLEFTWNISLHLGDRALSALTDGLYENASLGDRNWVVAIFAILFLMIPPILMLSTLVTRPLANKILRIKEISELAKKTPAELRAIRRRVYVLLFLLTIFWLVAAIFPVAAVYYDLQLNAGFKQRMTILIPHISEQQEKTFRAQWASMRSRKDYENVNRALEQAAKDKGVKLPKPLLD